jgi:hypothetical protein
MEAVHPPARQRKLAISRLFRVVIGWWREGAPRTTALHSTIREKLAVTRHGSPHPIVADARVRVIRRQRRLQAPLAAEPPETPSRCSNDSDRSHHVPRFPLPVVTAPRSTENRNTHKSADRGFVPRRLSYASRRPQLFTKAEWRLWRCRPPKRHLQPAKR